MLMGHVNIALLGMIPQAFQIDLAPQGELCCFLLLEPQHIFCHYHYLADIYRFIERCLAQTASSLADLNKGAKSGSCQ